MSDNAFGRPMTDLEARQQAAEDLRSGRATASTPMERLEAWVKAVPPGQRLANVLIDGDYSKACCMAHGAVRGMATADDPDAAITAALAQAEGV